MSKYEQHIPDCWRIVKITPKEEKSYYRIISSWYGSYAAPDFWRISSGCITFEKDVNLFKSLQHSGSIYLLDVIRERDSSLTRATFNDLKKGFADYQCEIEYVTSEEMLKQFK